MNIANIYLYIINIFTEILYLLTDIINNNNYNIN